MKKVFATTISALLILTLSSMTAAYANPGHSISMTPIIAGPGASFSALIDVNPAEPGVIIGPCVYLRYDPGQDDSLPSHTATICDTYCASVDVPVAPDRCWRLEDEGNTNGANPTGVEVGVKFPANAINSVTLNGIGSGAAVVPVLSGGAIGFGDSAVGTALVGPFGWNERPGGAVESTIALGLYRVISFGFVDTNLNNVYNGVPTDAPGEVRESFIVDTPTAGEIIPIDTSALFIAGLVTNPLIMLSTLGVAAAGAFGVLRFVTIRHN
jgi:hypothetical protein